MSPYYTPANLPFATKAVPIVRPNLADSINVQSGVGAWVYGAWTQIVAPNDLTNHALGYVAVLAFVGGGNFDFDLQVGTGAAGSEAVGPTVGSNSFPTPNAVPSVFHVFPLFIIPANARVAARAADSGGNHPFKVSLGFFPLPL
jgi:hypothetical protein